jgi:hypothetical protein
VSRLDIPEVCRSAEGHLEVWIPWRDGGNRKLIKSVCGSLTRPEWDGQPSAGLSHGATSCR